MMTISDDVDDDNDGGDHHHPHWHGHSLYICVSGLHLASQSRSSDRSEQSCRAATQTERRRPQRALASHLRGLPLCGGEWGTVTTYYPYIMVSYNCYNIWIDSIIKDGLLYFCYCFIILWLFRIRCERNHLWCMFLSKTIENTGPAASSIWRDQRHLDTFIVFDQTLPDSYLIWSDLIYASIYLCIYMHQSIIQCIDKISNTYLYNSISIHRCQTNFSRLHLRQLISMPWPLKLAAFALPCCGSSPLAAGWHAMWMEAGTPRSAWLDWAGGKNRSSKNNHNQP